jgi:TonB-linked SusC/RagA family outer membrane protein
MVLMLTTLQVWAQRTVTGRVTDDKGAPLSNVSVTVKNSTTGTVTGEDGSFSINVPASGRTLVFSFADMTTKEVTVGSQSNVTVTMTPADRSLQEVVVVGYGTQRRSEITGNVAQVSGAKLRDQPIQTFEQGLSGRAAGVNINIPNGVLGNPPVIRVRGVNSISLSSYPLVVIDGVPTFTGDVGGTASNNLLGDINPADIESVEILKDASAAAIYGSRASAGVLLITTKRGRAGRTRVNYEGWAGWTKPYNLIPVLNAQEFTDLKNEGLTNAGTPPNGTTRGFYTMNDANGKLIDTRWYDYVYRTGFAQNHSLSISGANEKTNYYFSTGYTTQEGMFVNNSYNRMTGRFTLDHSVNTWLKVGGTFNYTNSDNEGLNTGSTGAAFNTSGSARLAFALAPNVSPYNADGSYNINGTGAIGQGNNKTPLAFTNPVLLLDLNKFTSESERILGNVYGTIRLFEGLNFKSLYGIDKATVVNKEFRTGIHGDGAQFFGAAQNTVNQPSRWNWQNTLDYSTRLASNHGVNLLLGAEQQYTTGDSWGADRRRVSDPFFNEFQGGFTEIVPAGTGLFENFLQSYFGRLNYDFKRKYFLSANFRRDGYSAFAQKWGTFYGGSAGWSVSEEGFWKDAEFSNTFSSLRVRGSYGMVGNFAGVGNYTYQSTFGSGLYGTEPSIFFNNAGNSNLTWEKSKKLDVGFNAGFFRDRLNLEFAYYHNNITDLILNEPQAPSRGIPNNSIQANIGSMVNKGIEFTLSGTVLSKRDFTWNANFNFTTVNNEVTALANNNADILVATGGLESVSMIRVGESIGSFYVVQTEGINQANGRRIYVLRDGTRVQFDLSAPTAAQRWTKVSDGTVTRAASQAADGILMGPALPKYFGGLDNSFRFKGVDLNVLIYYSGGNYVYNGTKAGLHDNRNWNNAKDALERWTKPGDDAKWPRVVFGDNISNGSSFPISNNVEKGDFIKVRNISLGYSLPRNVVDRINMNSIRVYVAALNPFTFTSYSGFDPEIQTNGNSNGAPSVDRNSAALARTVNVGINVGF